MTPEERATQVVDDETWCKNTDWYAAVVVDDKKLAALIAQAIREAEQAKLEEAAQEVCVHCRNGFPALRQTQPPGYIHQVREDAKDYCRASDIRALKDSPVVSGISS